MAGMTPTKRTLDRLRADGWTCAIVEHWNAFARRRIDLFNGIDILAIKPGVILGVQATTDTNRAARVTKLKAEPKIAEWLAAGGRIEVWTWGKKGPRGKAKHWTPTVTEITAATKQPTQQHWANDPW